MKNRILFAAFLIVMVAVSVLPLLARAECQTDNNETISQSQDVERVETPKALEGARILVLPANSEEVYEFDAAEYMVVKRVKKTTTIHKDRRMAVICTEDSKKNEVLAGVRRDHVGLTKQVTASSALVESRKAPVFDATYVRRDVLESGLNLGLSLDTNGTPRGLVGIDF